MQLKRYKGPDYSRKLIFYSKEQLFYCCKELQLKTSRKKNLIGDFRYVEVLERFPNCSTKNLNEEPSSLAFFYGAGFDRILGNDKGVGVPVFKNRKIKTTNKRNTPE